MCVVRSVYSSVLQRKVEDEQRNLGGLEEHFQQVKGTITIILHIRTITIILHMTNLSVLYIVLNYIMSSLR